MNLKAINTFFQLIKNQWLSKDEIRDIQSAKLKALISHAYRNVFYYRQLFDTHGINPDSIQTEEDLSQIPISTRDSVRNLPREGLLAQGVDPERCLQIRTSGSRGMPLDLLITPEEKMRRILLDLRALMANGYRFWDKTFLIVDIPRSQYWFQRLGILRREYISIFEDLKSQLDKLISLKPQVIYGLTSNLLLLAQLIEKGKPLIQPPKLLVTCAELLDGKTGSYLTNIFEAQVVDFYGSMEFGYIGWECPEHSGYHLNSDCLIVEFLKDGKHALGGESGDIVITDLKSYTMPLIRYSIGDVGIPSDERCPCGRGLNLMKMIEGRRVDFLTLPNGKEISPYVLTCTLEDIPGIERYQIVQEEMDRVIVYLKKNSKFDAGTSSLIANRCKKFLGEDVEVKPKVVEEFFEGEKGKFQIVISKVKK